MRFQCPKKSKVLRSSTMPVFTSFKVALLAWAARTQQFVDARRILESRIEFEVELRRVAQPQHPPDITADEALSAGEALDRVGGVALALEMREEDPPLAQVITHPDGGQSHPAQARVAQVAQEHQG